MKLKERFTSIIRNHNAVGVISDEIEKTADDYAIEFAEWITQQSEVKIIKKSGLDNSYMRMSSKELLEIFKKEKGL